MISCGMAWHSIVWYVAGGVVGMVSMLLFIVCPVYFELRQYCSLCPESLHVIV